MSLRALWLIKAPVPSTNQANNSGSVLYSRRFPLVEQKVNRIDGDGYIPVPTNDQFLQHVIVEVGRTNSAKFLASRDSCKKEDEKPVFDIDLGNGDKLWPIIVIEQNGIFYCCLCFVDKGIFPRPPLLAIPAVSLGFSLLRCLTDYMRVTSIQELTTKLTELPAFINEAVPFGVPRDTDCDSIMAKLSDKTSLIPKSQKTQQPAWKPLLHKGKSSILLTVCECIQATQCEQEEVKDAWEVYGTITCKAELEGATPDVTLNISHLNDGIVTPLDHLIIHSCVQSADAGIIPKDSKNLRPAPRRVRFIPPFDAFTLCHYTISRIQELPIFGVYQMKCDKKSANISVSVNLQLSDQIKNNFEYAELQIPFFHSGVISIIESNSSQGSVSLSPDRRIFVWNIGPKFPSKSLHASLTANIHYSDRDVTLHSNIVSDVDHFCTGQNSYCQLFFKISDFTYSGCYIDPKSIQVSPNTKFKLTTKREFLSTTYKIWNSCGDVLTTGK